MATRTKAARSVLRAVPKRVAKAQVEAEKALARGYKATLKALPPGPRKAVRELTGQIEATADELARRGKRTIGAVEKQGKSLVGRVEDAIGDLEKQRATLLKRAERAMAALERRGAQLVKTAQSRVKAAVTSVERGVAGAEKRAVGALAPLVGRLELATHGDIEKLSKRIAQLERKLGRRGAKLAA